MNLKSHTNPNDILPDGLNDTTSITDIFNTTTDSTNNSEYYHKQYLYILIILLFGFFILAYYLYYTSKNFIKNAKVTNSVTSTLSSKSKNLTNLSLANFSKIYSYNIVRGLSLVYIVFVYNKTSTDTISFFNYFCHIFPTLIYFSVFFTYIQFLIEKFYEFKSTKKDVFFAPSVQFFTILVYIVMFIITISCFSKRYIYL
jgi:hypothetical protein